MWLVRAEVSRADAGPGLASRWWGTASCKWWSCLGGWACPPPCPLRAVPVPVWMQTSGEGVGWVAGQGWRRRVKEPGAF